MALPAGWDEIAKTAPDTEIAAALALLNTTFPKRYLHFNVAKLRAKMEHERDNNDGNGAEALVSSLRLFRHTTNAVVDITLFFFLRYVTKPRAYCISVGVKDTVTQATLHGELVAMCRYLQNEQSQLSGVSTIDIVSHKQNLAADLDETANATIVAGAFTLAQNQLFYRDIIQLDCPWPSELYRWEVAPLGP